MIVDHLKTLYRAQVRIRVEPEVVIPVRWFWCAPGALPLPTETAFGSNAWETDDREYPQPGLGEIGPTWERVPNVRPAAAAGQGTTTPLEWFVDGLPPDFVYPPPNPGVPVVVDLKKEVDCMAGDTVMLTAEAALAGLQEELPAIRQWRFVLFTWPAEINDQTTYADLVEASFPGYARLAPTWTEPALATPNQATTFASTLSWTRVAGDGAPQTIFGWAAIGPGAPVRLRLIQLLPTPITLTNPGENVTLCPLQLFFGLCPPLTPKPTLNLCSDALGPQWYAYWANVAGFNGSGGANGANGMVRLQALGGCVWRGWYPLYGLPPGPDAGFQLTFGPSGNAGLVLWDPGNFVHAIYQAPAPVNPAGPITFVPLSIGPTLSTWPSTITVYGVEEAMPLIGEIIEYGGDDTPALYLEANGAAVSRTTFKLLFARYAERYGAGDGSTTFNLPDRRDRVAIGTSPGGLSGRPTARTIAATGGEEAHVLTEAELAAHVHPITDPGHGHQLDPSGASALISSVVSRSTVNAGGGTYGHGTTDLQSITSTMDGITNIVATDSAGGDDAHNTMQPFLVSRFLVYAGE
jgi:microcystin-dependent protein